MAGARRFLRICILRFFLVGLLVLEGFPSGTAAGEPRPAPDGPSDPDPARDTFVADWDTLVAAGDTMVARWQHDLVARRGLRWPLAGVAPILSGADAALANLECCVALGGFPAPKGERCPFYYRARPEMLRSLVEAGIDIVTAANNHAGDYGPSAVAETIAWTREHGLVTVGVGEDEAEAERPRLVRIGRTRVAICGLDTTMPHSAAGTGRPGTSHVPDGDGGLDAFTEKVRRLGAWARGRCDLLILTVHWGDNWVRDVPPAHRRMVRIAFDHGVDLILGHSAHRLQGLEVVDGKVVLYDMGNLLFDCLLQAEGRRSALFRLRISPAGTHRVEVIPIEVLEGHAIVAPPEAARATLREMRLLSEPLGTRLLEGRDAAGAPVGILDIAEPRVTPRPPVGTDLAGEAPVFASLPLGRVPTPLPSPSASAPGVDQSSARATSPPRAKSPLRDRLPDDAVKVVPPREVAPGVELLGFRLPETAAEGGILTVTTWWRVTRSVPEGWLVALEIAGAGGATRRGTPWYTRHDPGDWLLPLSRMEAGEIVEDRYPARLQGIPPGDCVVKALVIDATRPEGEGVAAVVGVVGEPHELGSVRIEAAPPRR